MENIASIFQFKDILLFILSIYIPFFITSKSNKVNDFRLNTYKSVTCLKVLLTDMENNLDKAGAVSLIFKEYTFIPNRYYGKNIKISNRKKVYLAQIMIDNLYSIKTLDCSLLGCLLETSRDENIILDIYEYNNLIYNLKEYINVKDNKNMYINKKDLDGIYKFIDEFRYKTKILTNSVYKLKGKLDNNILYIRKVIKLPKIISNISVIIILSVSLIYVLATYIFGKDIIDSHIITNFLWAVNIMNFFIGYTIFHFILGDN